MSSQPPRHHFLLDVWPEEVGPDEMEWRGRIQHVPGGQVYYFRDWAACINHLVELLESGQKANGPASADEFNSGNLEEALLGLNEIEITGKP